MTFLLARPRACCAAVLSLVMATPASASGFCDSIRAIAADTPNGYQAFRGALTREDDGYHHYAASGWPEGALTCEIEVETDKPIPNYALYINYTCNFPLGSPSKPAAMRKFAKSLQHCMNLTIEAGGPKPDKDGGTLSLSAPGIALLGFNVITFPDSDTLRLNIDNR